MFETPTQSREQIDRDVQQAQERAVAAHAARARIEAVRGRAATRAGDVEIEVDSGGSIVVLELAPAALDRRPADLSAAIVQTMRQAQADVVAQVSVIAEDTFGESSATTRRIQSQLDERFVKPEVEGGVDWGTSGPAVRR